MANVVVVGHDAQVVGADAGDAQSLLDAASAPATLHMQRDDEVSPSRVDGAVGDPPPRREDRAERRLADADPWMTPPPVRSSKRNRSGRPSSSCIQSSISVSTSVHAGLVTQLMPCTPRPAVTRSPRIAGYDELAGK